MVNLEKEEFLQRLDVRLAAMASMLSFHESYIAATTCSSPKQAREAQRSIDQMRADLLEFIGNTDKQIQVEFARIKKEITEDTQ